MARYTGEPVLAHNETEGRDEPLWKVFDAKTEKTKYTRRFLRPRCLKQKCPMCSVIFVDHLEKEVDTEPEHPEGDSETVERAEDLYAVLDRDDIEFDEDSRTCRVGVMNCPRCRVLLVVVNIFRSNSYYFSIAHNMHKSVYRDHLRVATERYEKARKHDEERRAAEIDAAVKASKKHFRERYAGVGDADMDPRTKAAAKRYVEEYGVEDVVRRQYVEDLLEDQLLDHYFTTIVPVRVVSYPFKVYEREWIPGTSPSLDEEDDDDEEDEYEDEH